MPFINLTGQRFGTLVAKERVLGLSRIVWLCVCDCGKSVLVFADNLRRGNTTNCGCKRLGNATKHGDAGHFHWERTKEYNTWVRIKQRCHNPHHESYHNYGGRGIKVCDKWRDDYNSFLEDMGRAPSKKHTIERLDNNKDYEPSNCIWNTNKEQSNNRRNNVVIKYGGKELTLSQWAEYLGIPKAVIYSRRKLKWPDDRIVTTPYKKH